MSLLTHQCFFNMKKVLVIIASLALCAGAANAQSILGSLLGGSSSSSSSSTSGYTSGSTGSVLDLLKGSTTQSVAKSLLGTLVGSVQNVDLAGTWNYNGVAAAVSSSNVLGNLASSVAMGTVESKLDEALAKVGVKPGAATLTFGSDYSFKMTVGKLPLTGTWTQEDDKVTIKFGKAFTYLQLDGVVKATTDGCEILFDADKFLTFASKAISIIGNVSNSSLVSTVSNLVSSAEGLDAGFKLTR